MLKALVVFFVLVVAVELKGKPTPLIVQEGCFGVLPDDDLKMSAENGLKAVLSLQNVPAHGLMDRFLFDFLLGAISNELLKCILKVGSAVWKTKLLTFLGTNIKE